MYIKHIYIYMCIYRCIFNMGGAGGFNSERKFFLQVFGKGLGFRSELEGICQNNSGRTLGPHVHGSPL